MASGRDEADSVAGGQPGLGKVVRLTPKLGPAEGLRPSCRYVHQVFTILGKRWSGFLIFQLGDGPLAFSELRNEIPGISSRVLTARLRELEELGLVHRHRSVIDHRVVTYGLTAAGAALGEPLGALGQWAENYLPQNVM